MGILLQIRIAWLCGKLNLEILLMEGRLLLIIIFLQERQNGVFRVELFCLCHMGWMGKDQSIVLEGWRGFYNFVMMAWIQRLIIRLLDIKVKLEISIGKLLIVLIRRIISMLWGDRCIGISESLWLYLLLKNF